MEAGCWVDVHVKLMQSAAYFLRYRMRLVGRKNGRDSNCSGLLVYLLDSTLDLVAVGIRSGMGDMRTEET